MRLRVGIRASGEPSYFEFKPAQATLSKRAFSYISGGGAGGNGVATASALVEGGNAISCGSDIPLCCIIRRAYCMIQRSSSSPSVSNGLASESGAAVESLNDEG